MVIDFHSHILPCIDDGSRSIEESLKILEMMKNDGVEIVVATPHFYCHEQTIEDFLYKRNESYKLLSKYLDEAKYPKILLGAEVLYSSKLLDMSNIKNLCITDTNFLLLEMPYINITDAMIDVVYDLVVSGEVQIIVAHIERYLNYTDYSNLSRLMDLDVLGQLNARSFVDRKKLKRCLKLIKDNYVHVLGTDYHRLDKCYELLSVARDKVAKKFGSKALEEIDDNGLKILNNKDILDIM